MGQWIRRSTLYPTWHVRLFRPDRIWYDPRPVHEYPTLDGPLGELRGHLTHHSFNKGLTDWFAKHNQYAALEAQATLDHLRDHTVNWRNLTSSDPVARRQAMKALAIRLPCRPWVRFLYTYLWRGGFLDGRAGWTYCRMLMMYEWMIVLKMEEIRRRDQGLTI